MASLEEIVLNNVESLESLLETRHGKILMRANGLEPVGVISADEPKWDDEYLENRRLVKGVKVANGHEPFEEFLDWKNPTTGDLESCVLFENNFVVVTSRDSFSNEDDPENMTALSFKYGQKMKQQKNEIEKRRREVSELESELEEERAKREEAEFEADRQEQERESLKESKKELESENLKLREQVEGFKKIMPKEVRKKIMESAEEEEKKERAEEIGTFEGKGVTGQAEEVLKKYISLKDKVNRLLPEREGADMEKLMERTQSNEELRGDIEELKESVEELSEQIEAITPGGGA